jgi:thiol-disulfide isomerase/thioredoxin
MDDPACAGTVGIPNLYMDICRWANVLWPDILTNLPVKQIKSVIIGFFILTSPLFCFSQMNNNPDQAFSAAMESNKTVLLYFSGSDWCLPCQRFNKTIKSDSLFKKYADGNLILIEADFPQKTKLSRQQVLWNEKLAEEFNPNGIFPYLLLVHADKSIITSLEYLHYDPKNFIEEIKTAITGSPK